MKLETTVKRAEDKKYQKTCCSLPPFLYIKAYFLLQLDEEEWLLQSSLGKTNVHWFPTEYHWLWVAVIQATKNSTVT